MAKINSNQVTFVDLTESRKLDVYISSNLPTTQIKNLNNNTYTPDWSVTNLVLSVDVFLDSKKLDTVNSIVWYEKVGTGTETQISTNKSVTISTNKMSSNSSSIITYICKVTYQNLESQSQVTFVRTDTGLNGSDGTNAPAVVAQYSADGSTSWTSTLNATIHKYIRHSYDGGKTWSVAIKMVGEDGTSVKILGTATSATQVSGTDYYTLVYSSTSLTSAELGDAYLYDGDLYVCADSRDGQDYFINVGNIQGPSGNDGKSSYVFIRYATDANGTNMSTSPTGKTYMGVYTSDTNVAPTTASLYTWSKFVGDNAKSIVLSGDSQVFKVNQSNSVTPSTIKVTAQVFNTTITSWTYSTNGGQTFLSTVPTGVSRNGNIVNITGSSITSNSLTIKASDGTIEDVFTVYKAFDGIDGNPGDPGDPAPIAFLTNENVTFSADAQGQIIGTTITSNVVAYNGTTKVTPTIGTISGSPTGMTITSSTITASNEVMLTITIANKSTLGSTSSNMGVISIPITSPVSTVLYLTWSKVNTGATGVGIASTTVSYGESDSSSVQPTSWQSTIPDVADGKYLWTRTIIDYTDTNKADTVTYTYAKQGVKGDEGNGGTSVTVSSIQYQEGTSASSPPTGIWSNSVVAVADGKFLWTKTAFSDGKTAYGVARQGLNGSDGRGIKSVAEYYLATSSSSGVTTSTSGWTTEIQTITTNKKYLWNYEVITYTDNTTSTTTPIIIGVFGSTGETGKGIKSVTEYYLATTLSTGVTTSTTGWTTTIQSLTSTNKYLWNYELITYTDNSTATISPVIIGVYGDKGDKGIQGDRGTGISSVTVTYGTSTSASTQPTSWQTTMPTVAEGAYLWTRTITDYTDSSIADTVTYTYAKQGAQGGIGPQGTSVAVSSIQYQSGTSATTAPTGTWSNSVVSVAEGGYLWTKTTFSDGKIAYGVARQGIDGDDGRGITSIAEQYYQSTSSTAQSGGSWSTTVPTWADGKYMWTRSVITYTDSTTSTTSPICITGQKGGTGVGVSSVDVWYYQSTSATTLSGGSWSTTAPTWSDGKYVWTKTITTYTNSTTDETVAVCITGQKGATGVGVKSVTEYYLATASSSGVTTSTSGWTTSVQTISSDKKYLWNYEVITYTNDTTSTTTPVIIGVFGDTGNTGKGIKSVTEYYLATTASSGVATSTSGWTTTMQTLTSTKKYLWNYELITYTDDTTTTLSPVIIGVYGDQGTPAISVMLSSEAHLFEADSRGVPQTASITVDVVGYQGLTQSATTVGTITGLPSAGMTATILNNGATNTQIQIAVTESLTSVDSGVLTIPVTVNGKVVNKIFSWTKSKEGLAGERGSAAISFSVYSGNGYVLSKDVSSITLQTFAYNGDVPIEAGATYQWYKYNNGNWTSITNAINSSLNVSHQDVNFSCSYMCKMIFNGIEYVDVVTITDKNDTNMVFTSKPSTYSAGDIWIVGADYIPSGVSAGTVLKAEYTNNTYNDKDWVSATKYDSELNNIKKDLETYHQYFDFDDDEGLKITARDKNGVSSKFSTTLTNEQLSFNYGDDAVAYINGTSMHIKEAEIESPLTVTGKYSNGAMLQAPIINIGNFSIVVESNGSLSIVSNI